MQPASSTHPVPSTSPSAFANRPLAAQSSPRRRSCANLAQLASVTCAAAAAILALLLSAQAAQAQGIDRRYLDEPTRGVTLPTTPLAGEHDARALSVNPAGLQFLRGPEALLVVD